MSASCALALDAAVSVGTVALFRAGVLVAEASVPMRGARQELLMPAVAAVLADGGAAVGDLEEVICGAGPGSFTSLRIAAAIAKGIAAARRCALRTVGSLALLPAGAPGSLAPGRYLAALDAMRDECFAAELVVDQGGVVTQGGPPRLVARAEVERAGVRLGVRTLGPGMSIDAAPHARGALLVAHRPLADLDAWEPDYGRLAEAQVRWEAAHGRPLTAR